MHLMDDDSVRLDAQYSVEAEGEHLALIMESRSGRPAGQAGRNPDYNHALTLLLARLGALRATLVDALVDSRWTQQRRIPEEGRRLILEPIPLSTDELEAKALRIRLAEAQAKVAANPATSKAGGTKRIRLRVDVPGYGPADASTISQILATPIADLDQAVAHENSRYIHIGDELVTSNDIREALDWLDAHMGSQHDTFTNAMQALKNPLAKWSEGRRYKGLRKNADKSDIRAFLWGRLAEFEVVTAIKSAGVVAASSGQGFAIDQKEKVAVENRAMAAARIHYEGEGWQEDAAQKDAYKRNPFDLILNRDGEVKHVEVKGTRQKFEGIAKPEIAVFLTANEVEHARHCQAHVPCQSTELFIFTDVEITRDEAGEPIGAGGEPHLSDLSNLNEKHLKPIAFRYMAGG
jgi:Domain of unknown function (DUF3883)